MIALHALAMIEHSLQELRLLLGPGKGLAWVPK
jgi:hypothetical protein